MGGGSVFLYVFWTFLKGVWCWKIKWDGGKIFKCYCKIAFKIFISQSVCIPPRDFVSAWKTLVMEMLWGKLISVLLWENNTVLERECKCNVALLRTNANILLTNPEFHWGIRYFWKRTQMFVSEISLKTTAFPTKLCACSQNICVLSQNYCFPHRKTYCSLARNFAFSSHLIFLYSSPCHPRGSVVSYAHLGCII